MARVQNKSLICLLLYPQFNSSGAASESRESNWFSQSFSRRAWKIAEFLAVVFVGARKWGAAMKTNKLLLEVSRPSWFARARHGLRSVPHLFAEKSYVIFLDERSASSIRTLSDTPLELTRNRVELDTLSEYQLGDDSGWMDGWLRVTCFEF